MSSLADEFVKTGMEKGMTELIKKMLDNGVEPAFIAKNTGVPLYKIEKIQHKELV